MKYSMFLSFVVALAGCNAPPAELTDLGPLPAWELHDQDGKAIGSAQLKGRPWVANFLFTSCPTSCPPLAKATADLQQRLSAWMPKDGPAPVQIVSISVDPETDTPAKLHEFGVKYGADSRIWKLATAGNDYAAMEQLVTGGFMMPVIRADRSPGGKAPEGKPTPIDTAHSLRFVLVDGAGHIRGLYEKDDASLAKLDRAARWLAEH